MKEAVILDDGYIVYLDEISDTTTFDINETDILFSNITGRVKRFKGNQGVIGGPNNDYFMALYDPSSNNFLGYFPELAFWGNDKQVEGSNRIGGLKEKDERYFNIVEGIIDPRVPRFFNHLQKIEENTKVLAIREEITWYLDGNDEITDVKLRTSIKEFYFKNTANVNNYPSSDFTVNGNQLLFDGRPLNFEGIDNTFWGYNESDTESNIEPLFFDYLKAITDKGFRNPDGSSSFNNDYDETLIADVIHLFHQLLFSSNALFDYLNNENIYIPFQQHFDIINSFTTSTPMITEEEFYNTFTREYFSLLRLRLIEFKEWVNGVAFKADGLYEYLFLRPERIDFLSRIVSLFSHLELSKLDYDIKIGFLENMIKNNYWVSGKWNPFSNGINLSEEEVIVKIVQSISNEDINGNLNYDEISGFLELLSMPPSFLSDTKSTYYQLLYEAIDDQILFGDDGKGSKGKFVKAIYLLWLNSVYNPNAQLPSVMPLVQHQYTNYKANWQFEDENLSNPIIDESATPELINYESEKVLLWYNDNFNFPFKEGKIVATHKKYKTWPKYIFDTFFDSILSYKKNERDYIPYGFYDIFTPISIVRTGDLETIIGIPVADNVDTPCALNSEDDNRNQIPIFYMKYVDDLGDYSDFKETIGVVVDVALTFAGGIGIYKNLASGGGRVLRRYLAGEVLEAAAVNALRKIAFQSWELILGAASLAYSLASGGDCSNYSNSPCSPPQEGTPAYDDFKRCQAINKWLFALEIVTLSGDLLARRAFQKATRELNQSIPNDPTIVSNGFIDLKAILNQIDNLDAELAQYLLDNPTIANRLDALRVNQAGKIDFMFDFRYTGNDTLVKLLDNNAIAVDRWKVLRDLNIEDRRYIKVITNTALYNGYIRFCSKPDINEKLRTLKSRERIAFIEKYQKSPFNGFTNVALDKINRTIEGVVSINPAGDKLKLHPRVDLMIQYMKNPRVKHLDKFEADEIKDILEVDFNTSVMPTIVLETMIDFLGMKTKRSLSNANKRYSKKIKHEQMSDTEFDDLTKGKIGGFVDLPGSVAYKEDTNRIISANYNRYLTKTEVYEEKGGNLIEIIDEDFLSGEVPLLKRRFKPNAPNTPLPSLLTEPSEEAFYNFFSKRAIDKKLIGRENDTELKFLYSFLTTHWQKGNYFKISVKSTLYTCTSCQGYLIYLQDLAAKHGKKIDFIVTAKKEITDLEKAQKLMKKLNP